MLLSKMMLDIFGILIVAIVAECLGVWLGLIVIKVKTWCDLRLTPKAVKVKEER